MHWWRWCFDQSLVFPRKILVWKEDDRQDSEGHFSEDEKLEGLWVRQRHCSEMTANTQTSETLKGTGRTLEEQKERILRKDLDQEAEGVLLLCCEG